MIVGRKSDQSPRRSDDSGEEDYSNARGRATAWGIIPKFSIEGLFGLLGAGVSIVYSFAFLTARVEQSEKQQSVIEKRLDGLESRLDARNDQIQSKLDSINEKVDRLVGEIDGNGSNLRERLR
jgi:tetrahydromethanopterin S-methyltransferase subunit G